MQEAVAPNRIPLWCVCCSRFESDAAVLFSNQQSEGKGAALVTSKASSVHRPGSCLRRIITVCRIVGSLPSVDPLLRYDLASSFMRVVSSAILL